MTCHEPAEVSQQGDGTPKLLLIKKHGHNTTCFAISQFEEKIN